MTTLADPNLLAQIAQISEDNLTDQFQPLSFTETTIGGGVTTKTWAAQGPMLAARLMAAGQNAREPIQVDALVSEIPMIVSLPRGTVLSPAWRGRAYITIKGVVHIVVYKIVGPHNTPRSYEMVTKYLLLGPVPEVVP